MDEREATRAEHPAIPSEALGAPPGPRSMFFKVASAALSGGLLVLLFVALVPAFADFEGVVDSIKAMSAATVVVLFLGGVAIRILLAAAYAVTTPGLSLWRSLIAREASSAVSNVIPGPSGTAAQFVILRSYGVNAERFARATLAVSVTTDVLIFVGPGLFFVLWVLAGAPAAKDGQDALVFGLVALVVAALAIAVVVGIVGSPRLAAWLGRAGQACVNPFRRLTDKPPITTWPDQTLALRADTIAELRLHGVPLLAYIVGGYALNGLLLVASIWACGVSGSELPLTLGLLLYAVGRISTVVAITPGGVGVVEIAYTAVYVSVLGESAHNAVFAGVLVYRAMTYLLPIVTGALAYLVWRIQRRRAHAEPGTVI